MFGIGITLAFIENIIRNVSLKKLQNTRLNSILLLLRDKPRNVIKYLAETVINACSTTSESYSLDTIRKKRSKYCKNSWTGSFKTFL